MKLIHLVLFSMLFSFSAVHSQEDCQNLLEELERNPPNLNEYVFHSRCGTKLMFEIQKASEIKYGSNLTFLDRVLDTAIQNGITSGVAVDLGSGTGVWTKHLLAKSEWEVHAVDFYKPSLDELEKSISEGDRKRLFLHLEDFRHVAFPEKVELVLANNSLPFVPRSDLKSVIDNIYDNLAPGGILAATFWGDQDVRAEDPELSTFTQKEVVALFKDKFILLSCCNTEEGLSPNLDGDIVRWQVIYVIVQKPYQ